MLVKRKLIERYVAAAILPYFALSLILLTTVLLLQQANRFAETLGSGALSFRSALEVTVGILPGVLVFTVPMSALTGVAVGISRMASDSELIALQASGVGRGRFLLTVFVFGGLLAALTLSLGMEVSPRAIRLIKGAALQAIAHKLESPVDLREFNLSLPGKVIYVRDGDKAGGEWRRIFINWRDQGGGGPLRLITARSGRIDSSDTGQSELVLRDAVVTTIDEQSGRKQEIISEHAQILRIKDSQLNSNRDAIIDRMENKQMEIDEMNWRSLARYTAANENPKEKIKASLALHRRLALGLSPLVFAVLGALIGLRNRRGGRALGLLLSFITMLAYYLVALAGEQLARVGVLSPAGGAWMGTSAAITAIIFLLTPLRMHVSFSHNLKFRRGIKRREAGNAPLTSDSPKAAHLSGAFGGLMDRTLLRGLTKNFILSLLALLAVFYVFTLFELLRFLNPGGENLATIAEYLIYLMPFAVLALAPMGVLVAVLITYALTARASEAIAWWAGGQSSYRLAAPGLLFAVLVGIGVWLTQERIMPQANLRQETLRARIKGGMTKNISTTGRYWLAAPVVSRIYSYEYDSAESYLQNPTVYDFDEEGVHLTRVLTGTEGRWDDQHELRIGDPIVFDLVANKRLPAHDQTVIGDSLSFEQFKPLFNRPSQISSAELSNYITNLKRREDDQGVAALQTALQRKRADPFIPVVMSLIGIPLGLGFGKRNAISALASSVVIGVSLWGANSGFLQLGINGAMAPLIAGWAPTSVYAAAGIYLLFHAKT